jgi:hypothetical protein
LGELKQLLDDFPIQEEKSRKEFSDVSTKGKRSRALEAISVPGASIPDQLRGETKPVKVKAGRKAPARKIKRGNT